MPVQFFFFSRETFGALVMLMPDISFQIQMLDDLSLLVKLPRRYPEVANIREHLLSIPPKLFFFYVACIVIFDLLDLSISFR
mmetsp:Transcript_29813/g.47001  ORF Transcript_29813/g.47001 Transcript_29813/m.47001 type:complete len:82 (-) Transcript_29813:886-1131(-)